ncbi:MAG: hypothetical protein HKN25_03625 [Pyrinomonadaceae bacterium]|nr:hypothetical protein [Pyrinomonadaceae bacterium]
MRHTIILLIVFGAFQVTNAGWRRLNTNTLAWLKTIHFSDAENGWIGGTHGTLLKTADGGRTWRQRARFTEDTIRQVHFFSKSTGWLLCERNVYTLGSKSPSYLLKTTDGGENWTQIDFENKQRQRITNIFFANSGFGLAVGETGALFGLEDDNYSWKKLLAPSRYLILGGSFSDNLRGTIVGGGGTIFFTEDAGASWNPAYVSGKTRSKLNSVYFADAKHGWAVGSKGKIYQTVNGGRFWRAQRSNISENLNDVFFSNTANGWAIGDNGVILKTTSGGNVWKPVRFNSRHKLEKIVFNGKKGWIVGFGGTIAYYEPENMSSAIRPKFNTRYKK